MTLAPDDPRHGTRNAYGYHRCRCDACRAANRRDTAALRARRLEQPIPDFVKHGVATTYNNWGCRCEPCCTAKSEANQRSHARRKTRQRDAS